MLHYRRTSKHCLYNTSRTDPHDASPMDIDRSSRESYTINIGLDSIIRDPQLLDAIEIVVQRMSVIRFEMSKLACLYITRNANNVAWMLDDKGRNPLRPEFYRHCQKAVSCLEGRVPDVCEHLVDSWNVYNGIRGDIPWTTRDYMTQVMTYDADDFAKNAKLNVSVHFWVRLKRFTCIKVSTIPGLLDSIGYSAINKMMDIIISSFWIEQDDDGMDDDFIPLQSTGEMWRLVQDLDLDISQSQR